MTALEPNAVNFPLDSRNFIRLRHGGNSEVGYTHDLCEVQRADIRIETGDRSNMAGFPGSQSSQTCEPIIDTIGATHTI